MLTPGKFGELMTSLAFASALVAMVSFLFAERQDDTRERRSWERLAVGSFIAHIASVLGIVGTLFFLIYTHDYSYHYVWSHSSNELPVHFMISCFWEGQEGSFLLWSFWHSILGGLLLRSRGEWRNMVMAIVASVELILSSMLLGAYVDLSWVAGLYLLLALLPGLYFAWRYARQRHELPLEGSFQLAGALLAAGFLVLMLRGQLAAGVGLLPRAGIFTLEGVGFWLFSLLRWAFLGLFIAAIWQGLRQRKVDVWEIASALGLFAISSAGIFFEPEQLKLGSTPFVLLRDVFPNEEVYTRIPGYVPANGNGLNPLLQNYWMVIHPPTLFLGFASALIPFAFVMAGLIRGKYNEWIKPALPWTTFSVMILGIGIIMGGYWAYETLNFGGYWNWDPVENSSFVPWLCGVASLHAMLIYQRTKSYLRLAMLLIVSTFLLVLYSTFLTRSGILGETSVHTFTDLGLSGQLLVLLMIYVTFVAATFFIRWRDIPSRPDESKVWSAEFMLFMGILVLLFPSLVIILATSLPVFNELFGTNLAPPVQVQLFYYKWTVWFAILFGVVSGVGQFLWWKIKGKKTVSDALFRPFLFAGVSGAAVLIALWASDMHFAFDETFRQGTDPANGGGWGAYVEWALFGVADELLLLTALFGFMANMDVLIQLIRKNRKGLKVMGGTVVHIGFALMLLGMLFSSGYDEVISTNPFPEDLSSFPGREKVDNVPLPRNVQRPIKDFNVAYIGKRQAETPVRDLMVMEENALYFRAAFYDKTGERYVIEQPRMYFLKPGPDGQPVMPTSMDPTAPPVGELDMARMETLLNENLEAFAPRMINNRTQYGLEFVSQRDTSQHFTLWPEAEINEEMGSILSHPARKIFWNRDIYVYTSSLPKEEGTEPRYFSYSLRVGDTVHVGPAVLFLAEVRNMTGRPETQQYDVAAAALIYAFAGRDTFLADPMFVIEDRMPGMVGASIPALGMDFAFVGVQPDKDLIDIQMRFIDPREDFVIIKAISKPFINLLWLGTFILTAGFLISIYRRIGENRQRNA
ncbi:MAG: hypothetical protein OHK0039_13230 [Bacteroidia bacterium]